MSQFSIQEKRDFALHMRQNPTEAEALLWNRLCRKRIGYRFERQKLIYGYIVDFYCGTARLAIEVDGSVHKIEDVAANDEQKEIILAEHNIGLLRFSNQEVTDLSSMVLTNVRRECDYRMQQKTPLKGVGFPFRSSSGDFAPVPLPAVGAERNQQLSRNSLPQKSLPRKPVRQSPAKPVDIPENQRITPTEWKAFAKKVNQFAGRRSLAIPYEPPALQKAWEQKHKLAEYLKKKQATSLPLNPTQEDKSA